MQVNAMERTWKDNLYEAFKISVCVFTLIMLMFGCMYVRDQHWLERPQPQKVLRTVQTDRTKEILVAADTENAAPDLFGEFSELFDDALRNSNVPYEEMINTLLESELAQQLFSAEEMEELRRTKDAGLQLFRQLMEIYGKDGG